MVRQTGKAAQSAAHHWLTSGPGVAVVAGPGLGKTRLAAAVCAALDPERFAVIRLVATTASRQVPFGAWGTVLSSTAADPAGTYGAVVSELARRSGRRRPVLVVDDAHVLDGPSAGVLLALVAHRVASVLVTAQAVADSPDAVVKLWKDRLLRRIDLRPLDQDGVRALAGELLDAPLAESTAVRLAYWSGGNPLHLTELIAHGRGTGELAATDGLWWWREAALPLVPPLLAELLDARLAALDSRGRDALHAVALAEPLGYDVVERIAPGAVDDLEDRGFVRTQDDEYDLRVVLAHPLLAALLDRRLTPARRRRTATTLLAAGAGTDVVTTALWQLAAPDHADVDTLLHAADLTSMSDPRLSGRFAAAAWHLTGRTPAAVAGAVAAVECGEYDEARSLLDRAAAAVVDLEDRLLVTCARVSHRCWVERDPAGALGDLAAARAGVPAGPAADELDSMRALVTLFASRPAEALDIADTVLARPVPRGAELRSRLVRSCALTLVGRTAEAYRVAGDLITADPQPGLPYLAGMARAALALAELWREPEPTVPLTDAVHGRWPAGPADVMTTPWPVLDGYACRVRGDRAGAIRRLREARVQQGSGEGLFRSEAAAWLAICLAESGDVGEAERVLATTPPDAVALVPGLRPWADAAIAAAYARPAVAAERMTAAAQAAHEAGAHLVELGYRMQRPDVPGPLMAAVRRVDAPRLIVAAESALARLDPAEDLLGHLSRLSDAGLYRFALSLAEAAYERLRAGEHRRRRELTVAVERLRATLGLPEAVPAEAGLTAREDELARLASTGLTDRQIAQRVTLSVRTVESHLARAYRKLGVSSRRELPAALGRRQSA